MEKIQMVIQDKRRLKVMNTQFHYAILSIFVRFFSGARNFTGEDVF